MLLERKSDQAEIKFAGIFIVVVLCVFVIFFDGSSREVYGVAD